MVSVHQAEQLLAPHLGEEAAIALQVRVRVAQLLRGKSLRVVDDPVGELLAPLAQRVAREAGRCPTLGVAVYPARGGKFQVVGGSAASPTAKQEGKRDFLRKSAYDHDGGAS